MRHCSLVSLSLLAGLLLIGAGSSQAQKPERIPVQKDYVLRPAVDFQSLLLLEGQKLTVLTGGGATAKSSDLPKAYKRLLDRRDLYVGLSNNKTLDLIDKKTMKVTKSIDIKPSGIPFFNVWDLAVHPTKPVSFVSINYETRAPGFRVLVIDETSGEISIPNDMYGTYLAADPAGQTLFVGYRDLAGKGFKMPILGGKFTIQSTMGDVNVLFSYGIDSEKGTPNKLKQIVDKVGGNGQGVVVSPDGARVAYLSVVGNPAFSGNMIAYSTKNLSKDPPANYTLKDVGLTTSLAFHPTLKIAAAPGVGEPAVLFDREAGTPLKDRLKYNAPDFNAIQVKEVCFAPDGKHLVLVCTDERTKMNFIQSIDLIAK